MIAFLTKIRGIYYGILDLRLSYKYILKSVLFLIWSFLKILDRWCFTVFSLMIMKKLEIHNLVDLVKFSMRNGMA